jgi:glycosyltransferase involved in cell wall biosynthesis
VLDVSICIPAYEEPDFLVRALASVFDQTYSNFEVIVTDDSRSTAVESAVKRWAGDPRLRYVRNRERLGTPENWNKAIGLSERTLIKMLHHDDWFASKQSLQQYVSLLESQPGAVFAFSGACARGPQGEFLYQHAPTTEQIAALRKDPRCLFFGNFIGGPSATLFRRERGFRFDPALKWLVDVESYIRILKGRRTFAYTSELWVNTMAAGPRQMTGQVLGDPGLQFLENAYVYKTLRFSGMRRLRCWMHFMRMARGLNTGSVGALESDAKARDYPFEVRIPLTLQKLRLAARRYLPKVRAAVQKH